MTLNQGFTYGLNQDPLKLGGPLQVEADAYIDNGLRFEFDDDFGVDTINLDQWAVVVEADGTDQSTVAVAEAAGGTVAISPGAAANDHGLLATAIMFSTDTPGRFECRIKATTGANAIDNIFVGLTDAKTETNGIVVSNLATPAVVATDAIGFAKELANGGDFWWGIGANNGTDQAVVTTLTDGTTYQKLAFNWANGNVQFYIDDVHIGTLVNAYRTGVVLCAMISATHVAGTGDPVVTVDRIKVTQERV